MDPRIPQKVVPESALAPKGTPKGPKELKIDKKVSKNHQKFAGPLANGV